MVQVCHDLGLVPLDVVTLVNVNDFVRRHRCWASVGKGYQAEENHEDSREASKHDSELISLVERLLAA